LRDNRLDLHPKYLVLGANRPNNLEKRPGSSPAPHPAGGVALASMPNDKKKKTALHGFVI